MVVVRARQYEQAIQSRSGRVGDQLGGPAPLLQSRSACDLDRFVVANALRGSHDLDPAVIGTGIDPINLVKAVTPVFFVPESAGERVDSQAEAVPNALGADLLDVRPNLAACFSPGLEEWIVLRRGAIIVQPQNDSCQMSIVWLWAPKLCLPVHR